MSKKANPTLVGAFVMGALILGIALLVFAGKGMFSNRSEPYVLFFDGSLSGLSVGAPVTFRGVKVGSVEGIELMLGDNAERVNIAVYVQFDVDTIRTANNGEDKIATADFVDDLIARGIRAQLQLQSLVTGQLQIQLDFYPENTPVFAGLDPRFPELPTIPSPLQTITEKLDDLPLVEIIDQMASITAGIDRIVNSSETQNGLQSLSDAIIQMNAILSRFETDLPNLLKKVETTVEDASALLTAADTAVKDLTPLAKSALADFNRVINPEDGRVGRLADDLETMLKSMTETIQQARVMMVGLNQFTGEDSATLHDLNVLIRELSDASRAVREAARMFERNPESLLHGKGGE